jgi:hypothetical protein
LGHERIVDKVDIEDKNFGQQMKVLYEIIQLASKTSFQWHIKALRTNILCGRKLIKTISAQLTCWTYLKSWTMPSLCAGETGTKFLLTTVWWFWWKRVWWFWYELRMCFPKISERLPENPDIDDLDNSTRLTGQWL